jgi:hypothetical protein
MIRNLTSTHLLSLRLHKPSLCDLCSVKFLGFRKASSEYDTTNVL